MDNELKTGIMGLLIGIVLTAFIWTVANVGPTSSKSGAMKVLRESGYIEKQELYGRTILYYEPEQVALNTLQCEALTALSGDYIIIINTCADATAAN